MKMTVQHTEGESEATQFTPRTEPWSDPLWKETGLPVGVANRLARVNRCLDAIGCIQDMLIIDSRARTDCEENGEPYQGLSPRDIEGLQLGYGELYAVAIECLGQVRDNHLGNHQTPARETST